MAAGPDPLHVVMMALLRQAHLGLESENLLAVLAQLAVHVVLAVQDLAHPIGEGIEHHGVIVQVAGLHELDLRVLRRHPVRMGVDPLDQDPGEQEVGKDDDAAIAEPGRVLQSGLDQREGHPGVADLAPAEPESLPQQAHDLVDVGVGVGIRGASADHHQHGVVQRYIPVRPVQRLPDSVSRRLEHLRIDTELARIANLHARVPRLVGAQHRRDVVLGVTRREQHAGNRQHQVVPGLVQPVETVTDDRGGELQKAALDLIPRQPLAHAPGDGVELVHRIDVATAVTANHDSDLAHLALSWCRPARCGVIPPP